MTDSIVLRTASAGDEALIVSMHTRSWTSAYRGLLPDHYLDNDLAADRAAHWRACIHELQSGARCVFIAEHEGEALGFVCVVAPDSSGSVLVDNLHAMPGHKGRGIGRAMLDEAARWARSRGARALWLSVLENNRPAIAFYESRGWTRVAREADEIAGIALFSLKYVLPLD
jgi:ribosomal protein S18 acetylase RimI-like enzyme